VYFRLLFNTYFSTYSFQLCLPVRESIIYGCYICLVVSHKKTNVVDITSVAQFKYVFNFSRNTLTFLEKFHMVFPWAASSPGRPTCHGSLGGGPPLIVVGDDLP